VALLREPRLIRTNRLLLATAAGILGVTGLALAACGTDNSDGTPPVNTRGDQYVALSWECPDGTKVYISEEGWTHGDDPSTTNSIRNPTSTAQDGASRYVRRFWRPVVRKAIIPPTAALRSPSFAGIASPWATIMSASDTVRRRPVNTRVWLGTGAAAAALFGSDSPRAREWTRRLIATGLRFAIPVSQHP
jgi:hypothetical protein